jgi:hypothetical protein
VIRELENPARYRVGVSRFFGVSRLLDMMVSK